MEYKYFEQSSLISDKLFEYKLLSYEIQHDEKDPEDEYIVELFFENIYNKTIYNDDVEKYFDNIWQSVFDASGLYLESIETIDEELIFAWGLLKKKDNNFYTFKPESFL
jgi:hypothetical protein